MAGNPTTGTTGFVGRDPEVTRAHGLLADVAAGRGGALLVTGEPGIGKSTLVAAALAEAGELGCRVLWATADELVARFPLRVLLDCLSADEQTEVTGLPPATPLGEVTLAGDPVLAMVERLLAVTDRLCARSPIVWVLDDLQWADEATLLAWSRLSRAVDQLPLLLIGCLRPVPSRVEVASLRRSLLGRGGTQLQLGPLPPAAIDGLLEEVLAAPAGPALRRLAQRAGGNPLYLTELVDALRREHRLTKVGPLAELSAPGTGPALPSSLTAAIAGRLEFLSDEATQVLRLAAVLGGDFAIVELSKVTGRTATELVDVIAEATTAAVLVERGRQLAFRHPLLRQALYQSIPAGVRTALHHQVAHAMAVGRADVERVAEQLSAGPDAIHGWALDWLAEHYRALTRQSPGVAAELLEHAVAAAATGTAVRDRLEAGLASVSFLLSWRRWAEDHARRVLDRTDQPALIGEMTWILAYALLRAERHTEALDAIAKTLADARVDPLWRARLGAERALILVICLRYDDARPVIDEALRTGEALGDPTTLGYALHTRSLLDVRRGKTADGVEAIRRALAVTGDAAETTDLRQVLLVNQMTFLGELDEWDEAESCRQEAIALAERTGTARLCTVYISAAEHLFGLGGWDDALAALDAVADQMPDIANWPDLLCSFWGIRSLIAVHRDDRAVLEQGLAAVRRPGSAPAWHVGVGMFERARAIDAERAGRPRDALDILRQCLAPDAPASLGTLRHQLLPALVRLATELGEADLAQEAALTCAADARQEPLPQKTAAADRCRGLVARDAAALLAAADYYRAHRRPLELAESLEDAAVLLARAGEDSAARRAFTEAVDGYLGLGAGWDVMRAETRMRTFGIRRGRRGPRRRESTGWASLTPTELTVARRVAEGKSNPDIAAELFLSRRTVQAHVSHILAKLDAHSRIEIARLATQHEETDEQALTS